MRRDRQEDSGEDSPPPYSPSYSKQNARRPAPTNAGASTRAHIPEVNEVGDLFGATEEEMCNFLRKVYVVIFGKCIIVCGFIAAFMSPQMNWVEDIHPAIFWTVCLIILVVISGVVTVFDKYFRKHPRTLLLVTCVTITTGILLGLLASFIHTEKILVIAGIVMIISLSLVLVLSIFHISCCGHFFFLIALHIAIGFGFLCIAYPVWDAFFISCGPAAFFGYFGLAVEFQVKGDRSLNQNEHIYAAVRACMLYMVPIVMSVEGYVGFIKHRNSASV